MFLLLFSLFYMFFCGDRMDNLWDKYYGITFSWLTKSRGSLTFGVCFFSRSEPFRLGNQLLSARDVYFRLTKSATPLGIYFEFCIIGKLKPPPSFSVCRSTFSIDRSVDLLWIWLICLYQPLDLHIFGSLGFLVIVWVHFLDCSLLLCCFFIFKSSSQAWLLGCVISAILELSPPFRC